MIRVLVITLKGDTKYQFGIDKTVPVVLKEIQECKFDFYQALDTCAVKISQIISVESVEYNPEGINND